MKQQEKEKYMKKVNERLKQAGFQVFDEKTPSLSNIIKKETSEIVQKDPLFFQRHNLSIPNNPEEKIFDLYYPDYGKVTKYLCNAGFFLLK